VCFVPACVFRTAAPHPPAPFPREGGEESAGLRPAPAVGRAAWKSPDPCVSCPSMWVCRPTEQLPTKAIAAGRREARPKPPFQGVLAALSPPALRRSAFHGPGQRFPRPPSTQEPFSGPGSAFPARSPQERLSRGSGGRFPAESVPRPVRSLLPLPGGEGAGGWGEQYFAPGGLRPDTKITP
jgi:hypothetical protein